jgi:hypothetical protein
MRVGVVLTHDNVEAVVGVPNTLNEREPLVMMLPLYETDNVKASV